MTKTYWLIKCGNTTAKVGAPTHADAVAKFLSWSPASKRDAIRQRIESVVLIEAQP